MTAPEHVPLDPTAGNELKQLEAMVNEQPAPGAEQAGADASAASDQRAERVAYFATKVAPFVEAFGSRLKQPLVREEARALTDALADVGAEIFPGDGEPASPWMSLVVVVGLIAVPRVIASMNERRRAKASSEPPKPGEPPAPEGGATGDPMLDGLDGFDDKQRKPH